MKQSTINNLEPFFHYHNALFHIEDISYREIINEVGTPVLVFSENRIIDNLENIRKVFSSNWPKFEIAYPYKTNYLLAVRSIMKSKGAYAEVMSAMELEMALEAQMPSNKIIFNGPGKTAEELEKAIDIGVMCINADSLSELEKINKIASQKKVIANVGIRVQPDLQKATEKAFINRGSKMGFDIACGEAYKAYECVTQLKNLNIVGVHFHISSRSKLFDLHETALKSVVDFMKVLKEKLGLELSYLNIGGGFDTRSILEKEGKDNITRLAEKAKAILSELHYAPCLIIEPGRYLVNDSCVGIGKIIVKKSNAGNNWLITDIGTNILIPTGNHEFQAISAELNGRPVEEVSIGDGICSPSAVIEGNAQICSVKENEYIVILNCGAYTISLSEKFGYTMPAIAFVKDNKVSFKKRESIKKAMGSFR